VPISRKQINSSQTHTKTKDSPNLQPLEDSQLESSQPSIGLLSPREIQELYAIAMPATAQSPHSSDSTSSPEPELEIEAQTRKHPQKQQPAKSKAKSLSPKHQTAHNMIEKRYRNNLNNKIAALRDSVPSLRIATKKNYDDRDSAESDLDGQNQPRKLNKVSCLLGLLDPYRCDIFMFCSRDFPCQWPPNSLFKVPLGLVLTVNLRRRF